MSKRDHTFKPLSLAQHFEAPDDFLGCFGWLCGYAADAGFLDDAAERFMRQTRAQRAYIGRIALALMLDPGNPPISLIDAPGALHLPLTTLKSRPFVLLHAKVALLGFRHTTDAQRWQLRLIVSTGNWTRETLEESLDLAWRVDLSSEEVQGPDDTVRQGCADMKAAWDLLVWLRGHFDASCLDAVPPTRTDTESSNASRLFESWVATVAQTARRTAPRFFDNRTQSLHAQLPTMIAAMGASVARNYLAMGSGFYESSGTTDAIPSVLDSIVKTLQGFRPGKRLLTASPDIDIFVNPTGCQAVAHAIQALNAAGWTVRAAGQPDYFGPNAQRVLHAKFLFSANCRDNSNLCNSAWLYLGSGNLTGPGFDSKMSHSGGNLEAGVLFAPESLHWTLTKGIHPAQVLTNVLPVQWESDLSHLPDGLAAGSDMPERETQFIAAPVAWLLWSAENDAGWLQAPSGISEPFEVLDTSGNGCQRDASGRFYWPAGRPRQVQLRWTVDGRTHQSPVPVLDEFGRFAATALADIDLEAAWWQLANFPMPPDDEDLPPDSDYEPSANPTQSRQVAASTAAYPVRQMMQLIENIAAKQTTVSQADWSTWCIRLEQCLIQAAGSSEITAFSKLAINPLSPLWQPPFRPSFAETAGSADGQRYEDVLRRVETHWNVASFRKIGALG